MITLRSALFTGYDADSAVFPIGLGIFAASLYAPWAVPAICATLSWRPLWQRTLLLISGLLLAGAAGYPLLLHIGYGLPPSKSPMVPIALLVSTLPAFVMRIWRHWTLAPNDPAIKPVVASVAALLLATSLSAAAAASLQWFEIPNMSLAGKPSSEFLELWLHLPMAGCAGLTLTLCLSVTMADGMRSACLAGAGVLALCVGAFVSMASGVGFLIRANDWAGEGVDVLGFVLMASGGAVGTLAIGFCSFAWMRMSGYRLLSTARHP